MSTIGNVRRSAGLALGALICVTGASWIYLATGAGLGAVMQKMDMTGGDMMPMAMTPAWTPGYAALMLGMWTVMMTAMMLPSAAPAVLRVAGDATGGLEGAAAFTAGYLAMWTGFGAAATALQWALDSAHLLSGAMAIRHATLAGLAMAGIGVYQLTPLKRVCLERCHVMNDCLAGEQSPRAWHMVLPGIRYGVSCLGCCAALMGLLFVGGLMNVVVAAAIAAWVFAEKTLPWGGRIAQLGAAVLIAGGTTVLTLALVRG